MDNILIGIAISLLLSAFFSGIEIAFVSSDPLHLKIQSNKNNWNSKALNFYLHRPAIFITTALVGNTITLVLYGSLMAKMLDPFIRVYTSNDLAVPVIQTIVATILVLILAEFLPKRLFLLNPNKVLQVLALPMFLMIIPLYPFVIVVVKLTKWIIRVVFKGEYSDETPIFGMSDLNNFIKKVADSNTGERNENVKVDTEILTNALDLKTVKVRDCMIPRTELEAVDIEEDISALKKAFISSGHSKVIVYKNTIDDIKGYCHSSSLFKKPETIQEIMSEILVSPETRMADDLMIEFISQRKSIALVVDEYGGTSGVVTIEDIIEEIFGDIMDEHDDEDLIEQKVDASNFILSGRHEIDYINETYNLYLPKGEYDTLGGLIFQELGEIPKVGSVVKIYSYQLTVKVMDKLKVERVHLKIIDE